MHLDYETFSCADLKSVGAWRYAFDPSSEILCCAFALDGEHPVVWHAGGTGNFEKYWDALEDPDVLIYAHNAQFEMAITAALMWKTWGIEPPALHRWRCTASFARRAALPAKLETLAITLGLTNLKDKRGASLIRKFSIMQPAKKPSKKNPNGLPPSRIRPEDDPAAFAEFMEYCAQDVRTEVEVAKRLAYFDEPINNATYSLDAVINARGVPVNLDALRHAQNIVDEETEIVSAKFRALTGFEITQNAVFLKWLHDEGVHLDNLQADTIEEFLEPFVTVDAFFEQEHSDAVKALLMKQSVAYASIKKIPTMLACAGPHDNRVRGTLVHHGAGTGRSSGALIQPQNFKRPTIKNSEDAYRDICKGISREMMDIVYGPPLEVISSSIRHFIDPGEGAEFLDVDYASIECRVVNWLAGQEDALEEYRQGVDRYKRMASVIYGVPEKEVNKHPQRFVGKSAVLGCIAEGELVLTDVGLVPIEQICDWHRLWDGVEYVNHGGLIHKGKKEVIEYQGLRATPDHIVFVLDSLGFQRTTDLWSARQQKQRLAVSGEGWAPIRTLDSADQSGFSESRTLSLHEGSMRMRNSDVPGLPQSSEGREYGVRSLRSQRPEVLPRPGVAGQSHGGSEREMQQSSRSSVQMVRGARDSVQIRFADQGGELDHGQLGIEEASHHRQGGQRRALRAGKLAICHSAGADNEYSDKKAVPCILRGGVALRGASGEKISQAWNDTRAGHGPSAKSSEGETQAVAGYPAQVVNTYDILNAGPRHRFTVSNVLVHNCGYGMGAPKFRDTCKRQGGYDLPIGLEDVAVKAFRSKHNKVVKFWTLLDNAAKSAVLKKGEVFKAGEHISFKCMDIEGMTFLLMRLPSGRKIAYPRPKLIPGKFEGTTAVSFYSNLGGVTWGHNGGVWGGVWCENACQGVAADILANGCLKAERAGFETATLVHDQCLSYRKPGQTVEELIRHLTDLPAWGDGLPLEAEGQIAPFYLK